REAAHQLVLTRDVAPRRLAGYRLDAPHARGHAALGNDLERADLAAVIHMRAAAKFETVVADAHHPHDVAVLLAEQGFGASPAGFLQRHFLPRDGKGG